MNNKEDKITITSSDPMAYIFFLVCGFGGLAMIIDIELSPPSGSPPVPIVVIMVIIVLDIIVLYGMIRTLISDGKTIVLTPEGYTVKVFFYKKTYAWNQLKTKHWEDYRNFSKSSSGSYFQGGLFLSPYRVRQKYRIYPDTYTQIFSWHPFSCVYIFFKRDPEKVLKIPGKTSIYYEEDEWVLRDTLSRWGIEIEEN